jgi:hypothetical protein
MVPVFVPDSLAAKIVVSIVTIVALILFIRAYVRSRRL